MAWNRSLLCGKRQGGWTTTRDREKKERKKKESEYERPVACSCLIEQSLLMREIDEIRTCGTNTQVRPSLPTVGELRDTQASMGASSGTIQYVDSNDSIDSIEKYFQEFSTIHKSDKYIKKY